MREGFAHCRRSILRALCLILVLASVTSAFARPQYVPCRKMSLRREPASTIAKRGIAHEIRGMITKTRGGVTTDSSTSNLSMVNGHGILGMPSPFWQANGIYVCTSCVGFLISIATGSHLHLDLIGTGAFALAAVPALLQDNVMTHSQWSSWAVAVWGIKLAGFLFFRATQVGHDKRLGDQLSTTTGVFQFWFVTFIWNIFCSMPYLLGLCSNGVSGMGGADLVLKGGSVIYTLGLGIETIADVQKFLFKRSNPGKFCNIGLWGISQHPNYLGNLILWFGILVMNVPWLIESASAPPLLTVAPASNGSSVIGLLIVGLKSGLNWLWRFRRLAVAMVSPLFMWTLFSSQATGAMMNTLELANSKYGNDPVYKDYTENVSLIFPKF